MKITRETEYALRCLGYLSARPKEVLSIDQVATATEIPASFLAKIFQKLQRGKLVQSFRGIRGGFSLALAPDRITVLEVLELMNDPLIFNDCVAKPKSCSRSGTCLLHPVWKEIRRTVETLLGKATFANPAQISQVVLIPRSPKKKKTVKTKE